MRFDRHPASLASLVLTALFAAGAGIASVAWTPPQDRPLDGSILQADEEMDVVATDAGLSVDLRAVHASQPEGCDVVLEARMRNDGAAPVVVEDGIFDLSVQKTSSPQPMGLGEVTFLALCEATRAEPILLRPGQVILRTLRLSPCAPFESAGRYEIAGRWRSSNADVAVNPFPLVIERCRGLACKSLVRSGA